MSGSEVWSQKQENSKVLISEDALAVAKGREAKKDSLITILESTAKEYKGLIPRYETQISNLNTQIKLMNERFEVLSLSSGMENQSLKDENKKLKKKNFKKVVIIVGEAILTVATIVIITR